jgi:23S rRNA (guanosine2251-2'-O)-methyltransferase
MTRLFGAHAVEDILLQAPDALRGILHTAKLDQETSRLVERARAAGVAIREASADELRLRSGGRGGASIAADLRIAPGLDPVTLDPTAHPILIALDQVTDPHNLGAILRSAAAFGASCVIVPKDHAAPLNDAAARASAGAAAYVPVSRVTNLARTLHDLHDRGYWPCALTGDAETSLSDGKLGDLPVVLVLGAEGSGLRPLVRRACKLAMRLSTPGRIKSLNVSVAAGIALSEIHRQRESHIRNSAADNDLKIGD